MAAAAIGALLVAIAGALVLWQPWSNDVSAQRNPSPGADEDASIVAAGPALEGLYLLEYVNPQTTLNSAPWPLAGDEVKVYWWAYRSACTPRGCVATSTRMDDIHHDQPFTGGGGRTAVSRFDDDQWRSDPVTGSLACSNDVNTSGAQTVSTSLLLTPRSDGGFSGAQRSVITSNDCGQEGGVISVPVRVTRVGDVPPGDVVADPESVG